MASATPSTREEPCRGEASPAPTAQALQPEHVVDPGEAEAAGAEALDDRAERLSVRRVGADVEEVDVAGLRVAKAALGDCTRRQAVPAQRVDRPHDRVVVAG